jgi:hypothetical protein
LNLISRLNRFRSTASSLFGLTFAPSLTPRTL